MGRSDPHAWNLSASVGVNYKPTPSINISTGPGFDRGRSNAQYVSAQTDPTATNTFGSRYVFADIDQFDVNLTTRVNWILGPKMSLQLYTQPFVSVTRYWDFKELAKPSTFSFLRYGHETGGITFDPTQNQYMVRPDNTASAQPFTFSNPNLDFRSLKVNAIFRWEWRLGSTLYLVWTENRQNSTNPVQLSASRDVSHLFSRPDDVFLVRLAYWFSK
jgi:hypothetical protein